VIVTGGTRGIGAGIARAFLASGAHVLICGRREPAGDAARPVNGYQLEPNSPFGGYRQSGLGREGGRAAVGSYTELKTVLLPFTDEMM